jgi:hypothetical protein
MLAAAVLAATVYGLPSKQPKGVARHITRTCDDAIDMSASPNAGTLLFDRVVVPGSAHVLQSTYQRRARPFHYVSKYGFQIKAGRGPVDVRVSSTWHSRLAMSGASSITFRGCPDAPSATPWLGYANVFTVKYKACVSIIVTVGGQSVRTRIPLGVPCPPKPV